MASVRGYEEKDPAIVDHLGSGYPRFVVHPFSRQFAEHIAKAAGLGGRRLWLTSSKSMAGRLAGHLAGGPFEGTRCATAEGVEITRVSFDGIHGVAHTGSPEVATRAKLYLQNIGGFISSREAEDHLVRLGLKASVGPEPLFQGDAAAEVRLHLRRAFPGTADADLGLANSGMNAVYAAFRAVSELQAARGRTTWVQVGWLYQDTIAILKKFTGSPGDYVYLRDVCDRPVLERLFAEKGSRIAGLITEIPTNPLIQTPDVAALAALCRRHGVKLVLDPSVGSAFSVNVLPHADVAVGSLTKYTGSDGDIIAGFVAINPAGPDAAELRRRVAAHLEPVYPRDLARLAEQIGRTEEVLSRISANTPHVVAFLTGHPTVREVFWALHPASREQYRRIARGPGAVGGMISFSLRVPLEPFYDRLRLPKGPSFGMKTTLICPFMYLAHYDLVTTPAGRAELARSGLDPDLLRLCVGTEPAEDIIAALDEALA
jgi:cystathionine gamma-synthase